jgi:hypothetical protein
MKINDTFNSLLESLETDYGFKAFAKGMQQTDLVHRSLELGASDFKTRLKDQIAGIDLDAPTGRLAVKVSHSKLSTFYDQKQEEIKRTFIFSLVALAATIFLILSGGSIALLKESNTSTGILISLSGFLPGLLGGMFLRQHNKMGIALKPIERDILKMHKMDSFLRMVQLIADEEKRAEAYDYFLRQMEISGTRKRILVLVASPRDLTPLSVDEEVREIKEALRRSKKGWQFELHVSLAVRICDIRRAMLDFDPHFVHFSGHGAKEGLYVENSARESVPVNPNALAELFEIFSDSVKCVILNACDSGPQANAIKQHVDYVIGMQRKISDSSSIKFSVGFYDALGAGKTIDEACKIACNAIRFELPEHLIPVCYSNSD